MPEGHNFGSRVPFSLVLVIVEQFQQNNIFAVSYFPFPFKSFIYWNFK